MLIQLIDGGNVMLQVLLVDDDVTMLDLLQSHIPWASCGFSIMGTAQNGEDALKLLRHSLPDLIITDVKMPVMDGMSFCKCVCQMRDDIPIILLSAYEDMETARLAMKYNVTEYLLKPLNEQNIQLLTQILQESAHNHELRYFFASICNNPKRRAEIAAHLGSNDAAWFQDFFSTFTNCFSIRFHAIQTACYVMIQLLYAGRPDEKQLIAEQIDALRQSATKFEMVSLVAKLYDQALNEKDSQTEHVDYQSSIFQQILDYTSKNYMLPDCGAMMLSERFHFSADHINRLFHRYTGETLNVYITKKRMEYAIILLQNPDLSINEVAIRSGFRNQNYFARVFRKNMQVSPTEYRMKILLNAKE